MRLLNIRHEAFRYPRIAFLLSLLLCCGVKLSAQESKVPPPPKNVMFVPIVDEIDQVQAVFVKRCVEEAKEKARQGQKPDLVVFEVATFGGRLDSALEICQQIMSLDKEEIPSAAYITVRATSAGALISLSADKIYMHPHSSIGDAIPVQGTEPKPEDEKIVRPVTTELEIKAKSNGHNHHLAGAMCDIKKKIVLYENAEGEQFIIEEGAKTELIDALKKEERNADLVEKKVICKSGEVLNLSADEALEYKLAQGLASSRDELFSIMGPEWENSNIQSYSMTWSEKLAKLLVSPYLTGLLFIIGMMALYTELHTPGVGLPGAVALICFSILFLGKYVAGMAEILDIIVFVLGFILLAVEIFILPGFGIAGISGIVLIMLGLYLSLSDFVWPKTSWQWKTFNENLIVMLMSSISMAGGMYLMMRLLPNSPALKGMVSKSRVADVKFGGALDLDDALLGQSAVVESTLRPVGKIAVGEKIIDAVSEGEFIDTGKSVVIVKIESNRVIVRLAEEIA